MATLVSESCAEMWDQTHKVLTTSQSLYRQKYILKNPSHLRQELTVVQEDAGFFFSHIQKKNVY